MWYEDSHSMDVCWCREKVEWVKGGQEHKFGGFIKHLFILCVYLFLTFQEVNHCCSGGSDVFFVCCICNSPCFACGAIPHVCCWFDSMMVICLYPFTCWSMKWEFFYYIQTVWQTFWAKMADMWSPSKYLLLHSIMQGNLFLSRQGQKNQCYWTQIALSTILSCKFFLREH